MASAEAKGEKTCTVLRGLQQASVECALARLGVGPHVLHCPLLAVVASADANKHSGTQPDSEILSAIRRMLLWTRPHRPTSYIKSLVASSRLLRGWVSISTREIPRFETNWLGMQTLQCRTKFFTPLHLARAINNSVIDDSDKCSAARAAVTYPNQLDSVV